MISIFNDSTYANEIAEIVDKTRDQAGISILIMFIGAAIAVTTASIGMSLSMAKMVGAVNDAVARNPERKNKFTFYLYIGSGLVATIPLFWVIIPFLILIKDPIAMADPFSGLDPAAITYASATEELAIANANIAKFSYVAVGAILLNAFEAPIDSMFVTSAIKAEERNPQAGSTAKVNMFIGIGIAGVPGLLAFVIALISIL